MKCEQCITKLERANTHAHMALGNSWYTEIKKKAEPIIVV